MAPLACMGMVEWSSMVVEVLRVALHGLCCCFSSVFLLTIGLGEIRRFQLGIGRTGTPIGTPIGAPLSIARVTLRTRVGDGEA